MTLENKTILVLINDLHESSLILKKAYDLAEKNHALVEIIYVYEAPFFELPDLFISQDQRGKDIVDLEKIKQNLKNEIKKFSKNIKTALFTYIDDTPHRVKNLLKAQDTLVITTYHKDITQKVAHTISQALLIIKNNLNKYENISLLINLSNAKEYIDNCKKIFNNSKLSLLYDYKYVIDPSMELDIQNIAIIEQAQREIFESLKKDSGLDGEFFVDGAFMDTQLISYIKEKKTDLLCTCHEDSDLIDLVECDLYISKKAKV